MTKISLLPRKIFSKFQAKSGYFLTVQFCENSGQSPMTFVVVSANPSPKHKLLKEAVSDNIKSNKIHAFHHKIYSIFQAASCG